MIKLKLNSNLKINELDTGVSEVNLDLRIIDITDQVGPKNVLEIMTDEMLKEELERRDFQVVKLRKTIPVVEKKS